MPSEAQVVANRRNAEKSTGPRTPEGKAVVAQNAVKHGLLARQAVIKDEDPAEFEMHRRQMLETLAPAGPVEVMLAERAVSLSWRLKRAERMQDEAIDYLIEADRGDDWVKHRRSGGDPSAGGDLTFGRAVARDFAEKKTLDRLMMYERRIENSLYKTMNELHKLQLTRKTDGGQCPPYKSESAEQASDCAKQSQSTVAGSVCTVLARAYPKSAEGASKITPCGVTTNAKQSQSAHPAAGVRTVLRARPRVACHSHNVARSY